jgi:predicted DNA-binding transcriptional regulator AlpA
MTETLQAPAARVAGIAIDEALLCDAAGVAKMLQVSKRHVQALDSSGRLGPMGISLGRSRRWRVAEIRSWIAAGAPPRSRWIAMQQKGGR